jgi:hypothetical protein
LYWKYERWIRKNLSRLDSVLGATGAVYAMRSRLMRPLPPETLIDDIYLPLLAFFAGSRVVFEERAIAYDSPSSMGLAGISARLALAAQAAHLEGLAFWSLCCRNASH